MHAGAIMVVLWFGARLVLEDKLTAGALSAFVVYAVFVASNAGMLMGVFSQVMQASAILGPGIWDRQRLSLACISMRRQHWGFYVHAYSL